MKTIKQFVSISWLFQRCHHSNWSAQGPYSGRPSPYMRNMFLTYLYYEDSGSTSARNVDKLMSIWNHILLVRDFHSHRPENLKSQKSTVSLLQPLTFLDSHQCNQFTPGQITRGNSQLGTYNHKNWELHYIRVVFRIYDKPSHKIITTTQLTLDHTSGIHYFHLTGHQQDAIPKYVASALYKILHKHTTYNKSYIPPQSIFYIQIHQ